MAPPTPSGCVSVGVTGHRASYPSFRAGSQAIEAELARVLAIIESAVSSGATSGSPGIGMRMNTLLADGADQTAALIALERGWQLACPIPFGRRLNEAMNAGATSPAQVRCLLAGESCGDPAVDGSVAAIRELAGRASLFELADQDERMTQLLLARLEAPDDAELARLLAAETSKRVALAGEILIEQSDIIVAVWDGRTTAHVGGTGHTMAMALDRGAPVVWIDPARPAAWQVLRAPESLAVRPDADDRPAAEAELRRTVAELLAADARAAHGMSSPGRGTDALSDERWRHRSHPLVHGYRRIEATFGSEPGESRFRSVRQRYETPEEIGTGSGAELLTSVRELPGVANDLAGRIEASILRRFAWADGVSSWLSDRYRGGMIVSFLLSGLAIVGGAAYLPFANASLKWPFATFELLLLTVILLITYFGRRSRWHRRWLETRRVAEYLRHSALLPILGVARAPGRWPRGTETSWPEWYARQAIREVGLPSVRVTTAYLRRMLAGPIACHVETQRDYHVAKSKRLKRVDRRLDHLSDTLFRLAVASVALYLVLKAAVALGLLGAGTLDMLSKYFTLLGVAFPAFGSAVAGIRYFGDFERFGAISEITAEKLDAVQNRIELLLSGPDEAIDYGRVAELARATDDIVFAEIENWQSVFGGKQITIPI